jgi:hypothetical protein
MPRTIRRKEVVKWLAYDVARTQEASALDILHAFTKRIMPKDSKEKPADVFERIRQEVRRVQATSQAEPAKAARTAKKKKKKKAKERANKMQDQLQGPHQTPAAGPSSGDATQAAKEPTTAEKRANMFQAYDAL